MEITKKPEEGGLNLEANNNNNLLQLVFYPLAVVILHVHKYIYIKKDSNYKI